MRERHILFYPILDGVGGDTDGAADTNERQFAAFQHAAHGAGRNPQVIGAFVEGEQERILHRPSRA